MDIIKQIVKESLLIEVGDASAQPYKWWSNEDNYKQRISYFFKTKGGSKLTIEVEFVLLDDWQVKNLFTDRKTKRQLNKSERLYYINNPHYYWDTEFSVIEHKGKDLDWSDDKNMTISGSKYKTKKNEVFRIMATLSEIYKDFINKNKVRGFAFRPASDKRGSMFIRYFQQQLPHSKVLQIKDSSEDLQSATIVTIDDSIRYTGRDEYYDEEDKLSFRDKLKTKFNK